MRFPEVIQRSFWGARKGARGDVLAAIAVTFIFAILYARTLLHGIHFFGDTTKAQFLGLLLGTTHPTGYPLYILLSGLFARFPVGELATRVNAFSAFCGVVALLGLYAMQREVWVRPLIACSATFAFGVSQTFWSQAVIAEVYTLNAACFAGVLWLFLRYLRAKNPRFFIAACALYALSFGNHMTMVTLLPAFFVGTFFDPEQIWKKPCWMALVLVAIVIGMAQYAYLFWSTAAHPLYLEYTIRTWTDFVRYVSGDHYQRSMFAFGFHAMLVERLPRFARQTLQDFGPIAWSFLLIFLPRAKGAPRVPAFGLVVVALAGAGELAWVAGYDIPDIEVYLIPVELVVAFFIGLAAEQVTQRFASVWGDAVVVLSVTLLSLATASQHVPDHDRSARFELGIQKAVRWVGHRSVIVSRVNYSARMAFVYYFYAMPLGRERELHLSPGANPENTAKYLKGKAVLVDGHTGQQIPRGLRLFVDPRGAREPWRRVGIMVGAAHEGLHELTLFR